MIKNITYFGPISWYRDVVQNDGPAVIEACESYTKQTFRNRMQIATANGVQTLSVPVSVPCGGKIRDVAVSDHGNWRHQHWEALKTAYGMSPFFEYYADEVQPFFTERWESLFDYDLAITRKMFELLGITKDIVLTTTYHPSPNTQHPSPNTPLSDSSRCFYKAERLKEHPTPYYQTFQRRHGFIPDLSILDLLFNEGPEAILYLQNP